MMHGLAPIESDQSIHPMPSRIRIVDAWSEPLERKHDKRLDDQGKVDAVDAIMSAIASTATSAAQSTPGLTTPVLILIDSLSPLISQFGLSVLLRALKRLLDSGERRSSLRTLQSERTSWTDKTKTLFHAVSFSLIAIMHADLHPAISVASMSTLWDVRMAVSQYLDRTDVLERRPGRYVDTTCCLGKGALKTTWRRKGGKIIQEVWHPSRGDSSGVCSERQLTVITIVVHSRCATFRP
jgi:hypothetical protein